jgi:hypothetical protein
MLVASPRFEPALSIRFWTGTYGLVESGQKGRVCERLKVRAWKLIRLTRADPHRRPKNDTRRVRILGSTPHPEALFMQQVVRTLTMAGPSTLRVPQVVICD